MEQYIYFSFTEADRKDAIEIAERMKADGYAVWYDDGTDVDNKEDFLREKENEAAYGLIYLTKRFLSDVDKMDGLYNLSDIEKSMCFIGKEDFKKNRRFENEFSDVKKMFLSDYGDLTELLRDLYQNELVGSCRKNTEEFEKCIYYRDPKGGSNVKYRSLTKLLDEIFNRKCKMVEALEAEKEKLAKECEELKRELEECMQEKSIIEKTLKDKDASYVQLNNELKEFKVALKQSHEQNSSLKSEIEQLKAKLQQSKEQSSTSTEMFAGLGKDTLKAPIKVEKKEPVLKGDIAVGNIVQFGSYPQGKKGEIKPIDWEVLNVADGKALLLSKDCLDVQRYHNSYVGTTWADCSLRSWFNNEFLNKAFTKTEQAVIRKELIENLDNPEYKTKGGKNTEDKIFCLSISEAERFLLNDGKRQKKASNFTMTKKPAVSKVFGNSVIWWLRSPGDISAHTSAMLPSGEKSVRGYSVHDRVVCVCPALYVDLAKLSS